LVAVEPGLHALATQAGVDIIGGAVEHQARSAFFKSAILWVVVPCLSRRNSCSATLRPRLARDAPRKCLPGGRSRTIDRSNLNGLCPWADSQATLEISQVNGPNGDDKP
jgi:hypothetical protein